MRESFIEPSEVDPFEPPIPPKVEIEFVKELSKSFAKGQPYAKRIGLTLYRDQVHNVLKDIHTRYSIESLIRELKLSRKIEWSSSRSFNIYVTFLFRVV